MDTTGQLPHHHLTSIVDPDCIVFCKFGRVSSLLFHAYYHFDNCSCAKSMSTIFAILLAGPPLALISLKCCISVAALPPASTNRHV